MIKTPILYMSDLTTQNGLNTGIQRVVRQLAKALIQNGENLIPVHLDGGRLTVIDQDGLRNLSMFNGPDIQSWGLGQSREAMSNSIQDADNLLYPELPDNASQPYQLPELIFYCKRNNIKISFIFHDAIPTVLADVYGDVASMKHLDYMRSINAADYIFPVSDSSTRDYINSALFYEGDSESKIFEYLSYAKIKTIKLPTEMANLPTLAPKKINPKDIHIAIISSFDQRKNHEFLYNSFDIMLKMLEDTGINVTLHVSGSTYKDFQRVATDWWAERLPIVVNYNCDDKTIINTYKIADFTVYPSLYEGFGLPIVESLATNTPVLCSNGGSLKELAGGGCIIFDLPEDNQDFQALASEMYDLVTNPGKIEALQKEIPKRAVRTWSEYASDLLAALV